MCVDALSASAARSHSRGQTTDDRPSLTITITTRVQPSTTMANIFSDVDVSGFPDDALTDHQKYEHPLVS
eukprot:scaffold9311_cov87-Alexandrium_tamarense.AAC.1